MTELNLWLRAHMGNTWMLNYRVLWLEYFYPTDPAASAPQVIRAVCVGWHSTRSSWSAADRGGLWHWR